MAGLGLKRSIRWVANPADVEAWQVAQPSVAQAWASLTADNRPSTIALLLGFSPEPATIRWSPRPWAPSDVAAAWAFAVTLHMTVAEAASNACATAWIDIAARKPAIFLASTLLCPRVPVAPPPRIASAGMDARTPSPDPSVWPALCGAVRRQHVGHEPPTDEEIFEALMAMTEPMIEACEAGAFAHTLLDEEL